MARWAAKCAVVCTPQAFRGTAIRPKYPKPEGLGQKKAIHCVVLLGNNRLLPASYVLCLAFF